MILARNDVQDLRHMLDAVRSLIASSSNAHPNDRTLQDLVRLKEISRTSDMILSQLTKDGGAAQTTTDEARTSVPRFTADRLVAEFEWLDDPEGERRRTRGVLFDGDLVVDGKEVSVWIEWKPFGDIPVGGIKEKVLAAKRAGIKEIILPWQNEKDLKEVPERHRKGMKFHPVRHFDEVLKVALKRR